MIDERKIFKTLWENRLHEHAPISKYFAVLTKYEVNHLINNGYLSVVQYKDILHYELTPKGRAELEIHTFGMWKYFEVKFLHLIGKVVSWFKKQVGYD